MVDIKLTGFATDNGGGNLDAADVDLLDKGTTTPVLATTSPSSGKWSFSRSPDNDGTDLYDVRITNGTEVRILRYDDEIQVTTVEAANFRLRGDDDRFVYDIVPKTITADRTLNMPLLTGTATFVVTPAIEDLDMGGFDIDNAGFVILNAATAPAATEVYAVNDNTGDLTLNALSAKTINFAIAGADEITVSASGLNVPANSDILFTGTTGTNDINLVDSVADALSIVRGSTDMIVFDTSTPAITFTPAVTFSATVTGPSGTWDSGGMDVASGDTYAIDGTDVITATALGTGMQADQAAMVAQTNENTYIAPDMLVFSPTTAGCWVEVSSNGQTVGSPNLNVSSVTDTGTGDMTVNFITNFSDAEIAASGAGDVTGGGVRTLSPGVSSIRFIMYDSANNAVDTIRHCIVFGDRT